MEFENIIFQKTNQIATIRLNRPKYFNALDFPLGNLTLLGNEAHHLKS